MKTCTKCKTEKGDDHFQFSRPGVLRSDCKDCQKEYNREYRNKNPKKVDYWNEKRKPSQKIYRQANKKEMNERLKDWARKNPDKRRAQKYRHRYGIELEDYEDMLKSQDYSCKICKSKENKRKGSDHFFVDHCHKTKKVRGLLCHSCNSGLSKFEDNPEILKKAIDYLDSSK